MESKFQQLPKWVTPELFAEKAKISLRNLLRIRKGEGATSYERAVDVAKAFEEFGVSCTPEELKHPTLGFRGPGQPRKAPLAAVGAPPTAFEDLGPLFEVPVYSYAAAGPMTDEALVEEDEPMLVTEANKRYRHVRVRGRSLEPHVKDGEVVRLDEGRPAQNGDLVIFQLEEFTGCGFLELKGRRPVKVRKTAPGYKDIPIRSGQTFTVKAVVIKLVDERDVPRGGQ